MMLTFENLDETNQELKQDCYIHLLSHISPNKAKYSHSELNWNQICCYCFFFFSLNSELIQTETNVVYFQMIFLGPKLTPNFKIYNSFIVLT